MCAYSWNFPSPLKTVSHVRPDLQMLTIICDIRRTRRNSPGVLLLVGKPKVHSCMPFYLLGKSKRVCVTLTYMGVCGMHNCLFH